MLQPCCSSTTCGVATTKAMSARAPRIRPTQKMAIMCLPSTSASSALVRLSAASMACSSVCHRMRRPQRATKSHANMFTAPNRRLVGAALGTGAVVAGMLAAAGVAAVAAKAASNSGPAAGTNPRQLVSSGMAKFRQGDVAGAASDFDAAWAAAPELRPYLWQRGLAHYYEGRYEEGAAQFRSDVAVNPNDTEEAIWCFVCEARYLGVGASRKQYLQVGRDSRPVMRAAYECFRTGTQPDAIWAAIQDNGGHSSFYGLLYVGLWHEAHGSLDDPEARAAIEAACATPYARLSGDYMADLARVHCQLRGWVAAPATQ